MKKTIILLGLIFLVAGGCDSLTKEIQQPRREFVYLHQIRIGMTGEELNGFSIPGELLSEKSDEATWRCWLVTGNQWKPYIFKLTPGPTISPEDPNRVIAVLSSIELDVREMEQMRTFQRAQTLQNQMLNEQARQNAIRMWIYSNQQSQNRLYGGNRY